jgi:hypothetical protein
LTNFILISHLAVKCDDLIFYLSLIECVMIHCLEIKHHSTIQNKA